MISLDLLDDDDRRLKIGDTVFYGATGEAKTLTAVRVRKGVHEVQLDGRWSYKNNQGDTAYYIARLVSYSPVGDELNDRVAAVRAARMKMLDINGHDTVNPGLNAEPMSPELHKEAVLLRNRRLAIKRAMIKNAAGK